MESVTEMIDVHASISGAVKLKDLDQHLNRHKDNLHIRHQWNHAQSVEAVPIVQKLPQDLGRSNPLYKKLSETELKTKAAKLINAKHLMEALNKI